ncbi:MAG: hypothetical protein Q9M33_06750 [Robiginitomaculum sp.]|nr:hypothetical protein [Robiginitomaculum sp.]
MYFKDEKGNALFLILIAVVLFAALSYAVTSSMRGGGKDMSEEAAELAASRLLDYSAHLRMTIQRMMVSQYLNPEDIDFYVPNVMKLYGGGNYIRNNTNCTTTACEVFSPDGGGFSYQHFEDLANPSPTGWQSNWEKPGHWSPLVANVVNISSSKNDIVIRIVALNIDVCKALNRKVGLPEIPNADFAGESFISVAGDVTTKIDTANPYTFGDDFPDLAGAHDFCTIAGDYGHFYSVIIAR